MLIEETTTRRSGCTPDFLIIGAMKAGTTTFYDGLKRSSGVWLPEFKEPSILTRFESEEACRKAYCEHFDNYAGEKLLGEATTHYAMSPLFAPVAEKAKSICGSQLKILMVLRNPATRLVSHLRHDFRVGRLKVADFDEAVASDPRYVDTSNYAMQLEPWIETFGLENIQLLRFESFRSNLRSELVKAADFLGVDFPKDDDLSDLHSNDHNRLRQHRLGFLKRFAPNVSQPKVKRKIPQTLISLYRTLLMSNREPVEVSLSGETIDYIAKTFHACNSRLEALTDFDTSDWENEALYGKLLRSKGQS